MAISADAVDDMAEDGKRRTIYCCRRKQNLKIQSKSNHNNNIKVRKERMTKVIPTTVSHN